MSLVPKLVAAAAIGAAITAPRQKTDTVESRESVLIKIEWVNRDKEATSEKLTLRTIMGETTTTRQGDRMVRVTPMPSPEGTVDVQLNIAGNGKYGAEQLDTQVHAKTGETNVVMASTKTQGQGGKEALLFLTAERI